MTLVQLLGTREIHALKSATAEESADGRRSYVTCVCGAEFDFPGDVALYEPTRGVKPTCEGCREPLAPVT